MELKKHIPFIVIVLAILGTWNSTRLEFAGLRNEIREELRDLGNRITALDERVTTLDERVTTLDSRVTALDVRVSTLSERVARIEGVLSGMVSSSSRSQSPEGATSQSAPSEITAKLTGK